MKIVDDVRAFREACDLHCGDAPAFPKSDSILLHEALIAEEVREFRDANRAFDLEGAADALVDILYVTVGAMLDYGVPFDRVWSEVQAANLRKVSPETGKVLKNEAGKVTKPVGWQGPNIAKALWPDQYEGV